MARNKNHSNSPCPIARAVDIVGDRWSLLIIRDAFDGICRFGGFQASLGIARNILTDRLRMLEARGIIQAVPASDGSGYHDYVLTPRGLSLFPVLVTLRQWAEGHLFARGEMHSSLVERATQRPVPTVVLRGRAGDPLSPEQTTVRKLHAAV